MTAFIMIGFAVALAVLMFALLLADKDPPRNDDDDYRDQW